jgi:hypothetical protein
VTNSPKSASCDAIHETLDGVWELERSARADQRQVSDLQVSYAELDRPATRKAAPKKLARSVTI